MAKRPLENLALLVADLHRRVVYWRRRHRQAVGALHEKTLECDSYRAESEQKSRVIQALVAAGTNYGCRRELRRLADAMAAGKRGTRCPLS